jgi:hypothetical protein
MRFSVKLNVIDYLPSVVAEVFEQQLFPAFLSPDVQELLPEVPAGAGVPVVLVADVADVLLQQDLAAPPSVVAFELQQDLVFAASVVVVAV